MPSSATPRLRLELQAAGENLNTWGAPRLNTVIDLIDFAIAGWTTIALASNVILTSANYASDQARSAMLKFTGTGSFTVTIPSVSKRYDVFNATTGTLTLTTGAGASASLSPGDIASILCDGSNVYGAQFSGQSVRAYVDGLAFAATTGLLPGQAGNAGKVLVTDGTTAGWGRVTTSSIADFNAATTALAVAFATAL